MGKRVVMFRDPDVVATVDSDSDPFGHYQVWAWLKPEGHWSCGCPAFALRETCKHVSRARAALVRPDPRVRFDA